MTGHTCFSGFGTSVAPETSGRIELSVDAVTREIFSSVGHRPAGIAMILECGLHGYALAVTIAAKAVLMAHGTHVLIADGRILMIFTK